MKAGVISVSKTNPGRTMDANTIANLVPPASQTFASQPINNKQTADNATEAEDGDGKAYSLSQWTIYFTLR